MSQQPPSWDPDPKQDNPYGAHSPQPTAPGVQGPYHYPGEPMPAAGWPTDDPLVTPPDAGVGAWFNRVMTTFKRSWQSVGAIVAITQILPAVIIGVAVLAYLGPLLPEQGQTLSQSEADELLRRVVSAIPVGIAALLVVGVVQAVGWAGATWAMVREAAGLPAPLGSALAHGLRRALGLWLWWLLGSLLMAVGLLACILPGIYVAVGLAMMGPVYLFERANPIGRSFRLLHNNFGPVLGRVLILAAAGFVGQMLANLVQGVGTAATGQTGLAGSPVFLAVGLVLTLPFVMVQTIAVVITYAEQRAREIRLDTQQLVAALG